MSLSPQRFRNNDRGVSEVVGTVLILGFVIIVGIMAVYFGYSIIEDNTDARVQSQFSLDADNKTHIGIVYSNGDAFTSQDTERLYIVKINNSTEEEIEIYDGSSDYYNNDKIEEGDTVLKPNDSHYEGVRPGDRLQFVWVPENNPDRHIVVDELTILPEQYIFVRKSGGGNISTDGYIIINNSG